MSRKSRAKKEGVRGHPLSNTSNYYLYIDLMLPQVLGSVAVGPV